MKVLRIVNKSGSVYVERRFLWFFWFRVSPYFGSNIEAYNWVRRSGDYCLLRK